MAEKTTRKKGVDSTFTIPPKDADAAALPTKASAPEQLLTSSGR